MAALASCASCSDDVLVRDMIVDVGADVGLYAVKMFVNGMWITVVVDDYLPCKLEGKHWQPVFARSMEDCLGNDAGSKCLWVSIVEKAWAKLHGSYEAIGKGFTEDALNYLTGGFTVEVQIQGKSESDWQVLHGELQLPMESTEARTPFCTCFLREDVHMRTELMAKCSGVISGQPFSIVGTLLSREGHKLVKLRNPWGAFEWKGPFCDSDPQWSIGLKAQLGAPPVAEIGAFWMCWADFTQYFGQMGFCDPWKMLGNGVDWQLRFQNATVHGAWKAGENAGGRLGLQTYKFNPRFSFTSDTTTAYLSIFQLDSRSSLKKDWLDMHVYIVDPDMAYPTQVMKLLGRRFYTRVQVKPGKRYTLIVSTWEPGIEAEFWLSAASTGGHTTLQALPSAHDATILNHERDKMHLRPPNARYQELALLSLSSKNEAERNRALMAQLKSQIMEIHGVLHVLRESIYRRQENHLLKILIRARSERIGCYFSRWNTIWRTNQRCRNLLLRALQRKENKTLVNNFHEWCQTAHKTRNHETFLQRAREHMSEAISNKAFTAWAMHTKFAVRSRAIVQRLLSRWLSQSVAKAFSAWQSWVDEKASQQRVLTKALSRLEHGGLSSAFDGWYDSVKTAVGQKAIVGRVLLRMQQRVMSSAFGRWLEFRSDLMRARRVLSRLHSMRVSRCWSSWLDAVDMWKSEQVQQAHEAELSRVQVEVAAQQGRAAERILQRWKMQGVMKCFSSWLDMIDVKRKLRIIVLRLDMGGLSASFDSWSDSILIWKSQRAVISWMLLRMQHIAVSASFSAWHGMHVCNVNLVRIMHRLVFRRLYMKVYTIFTSWAHLVEPLDERPIRIRMQRFKVGVTFHSWSTAARHQATLSRIMHRLILRLLTSKMITILTSWANLVQASRSAPGLARMVRFRLGVTFHNWMNAARRNATLMRLMHRLAFRNLMKTMATMFSDWVQYCKTANDSSSLIHMQEFRLDFVFTGWKNLVQHKTTEMVTTDDVDLVTPFREAISRRVSVDGPKRVIVVSSDLDDVLLLIHAVRKDTPVVFLDYELDTLASVFTDIKRAANGLNLESIAFMGHGSPGKMSLLCDVVITRESLSSNSNLRDFFTSVASLTGNSDGEAGRIDLLSCSLSKSEDGALLVQDLKDLTGCCVAASERPVGSSTQDADWLLQDGAIDAAGIYLIAGEITKWNHVCASRLW